MKCFLCVWLGKPYVCNVFRPCALITYKHYDLYPICSKLQVRVPACFAWLCMLPYPPPPPASLPALQCCSLKSLLCNTGNRAFKSINLAILYRDFWTNFFFLLSVSVPKTTKKTTSVCFALGVFLIGQYNYKREL